MASRASITGTASHKLLKFRCKGERTQTVIKPRRRARPTSISPQANLASPAPTFNSRARAPTGASRRADYPAPFSLSPNWGAVLVSGGLLLGPLGVFGSLTKGPTLEAERPVRARRIKRFAHEASG